MRHLKWHKCKCNLVFMGRGWQQRYADHSWVCLPTLEAIDPVVGNVIREVLERESVKMSESMVQEANYSNVATGVGCMLPTLRQGSTRQDQDS